MNNKPKIRKVKGRFVAAIFLLSVVVVGGIIFITQTTTNLQNEQVHRLDVVLMEMDQEADTKILSDAHKLELEALKRSSLPFVRDTATSLLADAAFHVQNFEEALSLYQEVALRKRSHLAPRAQLNSAYTYLAMGKEAEASESFGELASYQRVALNPELLYEADIMRARLLEKNKAQEAIEIYQEIIRSVDGENIWRMIAQARLIFLDEKINF